MHEKALQRTSPSVLLQNYVLSNERYDRINTELITAFPLLGMKRAGKQSSIIWLVRQKLYHPRDCNISFSARRLSSPSWHNTNSFHSMLHHSRRHICHFCLLLFSASAATDMSLAPFQSPAHLSSNLSDFGCYLYFVHWTKLCFSSFLRSFVFPSCHSSVLFWMVGFLVSSKSLQDSFRLSVFRQVIIHRMLDTIRRSSWIGMCSGLRDSKRPSDPGSIRRYYQFRE